LTTTLVATPQPANNPPRVLLELTYTGAASANITRSDPDGNVRAVRLAEPATLISGSWVGYDYESFFQAPTTYTATTTAGAISSGAVVLNVSDVWLRHPGIPSLSMKIDDQGDSDVVRPVNQATLEPLNRRTPITLSDGRRKAKRGNMKVRTHTLADATLFLGLVDDVSTLLLDVPPSKGYGVTHEYRALGEMSEGRLRDDYWPHPWRIWTAPFNVVDRPAGGLTSQRTWATVLSEATSWAELMGIYETWADVLTGKKTVSGSSGATVYDGLILGDNPVVYLTLDGTAGGYLDKTGNGHHGVPHGSPTLATFIAGGAVRMNGTNQYVEIPDSADFSAEGGAITVEVWIKVRAKDLTSTQPSSGGDYMHWLGKMGLNLSDVTHAEWTFRMYTLSPTVDPTRPNRISFYAFNNAATTDNPRHLGAGSYFQDDLDTNTWMYVCGVINTATGLTKEYRDASLRDSDPLDGYNITPTHSTAPVRIGTADLGSFAPFDFARFAIYPYELSRDRMVAHFREFVPTPPGTARYGGSVGSSTTRANTSRLQITVGASGVPAGATLLANAVTSYTVSGPTMADSRGNVWTRERTGADTGTTIRGSAFRCQVQVALRPGDVVELRTSVAVDAMALTVDQYADVAFTAIHASNATSATSTTPGGSMFMDTSTEDVLVRGDLAILSPSSSGYSPDVLYDMFERTSAGTNAADGLDVVAHSASKNAVPTGAQRWRPVLGVARTWVQLLTAYLTGTPTLSPPTPGSATRVRKLASSTSTTSGTTLTLTVPADGVPVGHTLFAAVTADYTAAGATITDSAGNTWTRDRTAASTGNVTRAAVFSCPVTSALDPGDTITVTWAVAVTRKSAVIDQFSRVLVPTSVDAQTGSAGASGQPTVTTTTVNTNTVAVGVVGMGGPANSAYTPDVTFVPESIVGTSGAGSADRTTYMATRAIYTSGTSVTFAPLVDGSYPYSALLVVYRAA
jgi:hypothetical protein